jgi:Ca-activated chloride channel family protein
MSFDQPWWLAAAVIACAAMGWVWHRYDTRQRRALDQFIAPQLRAVLTQSLSGPRTWAKRAMYAASIALVFVALAGPQAGYRWEQIKRRGNDIIFAVDTSRSMMTPDVKPNRLERAKLAIDDFVNRLNGDAVGLIAFAGTAFLQTPLTLDYGAFHESLAALDTNIIPRGGTDITSAIHEAEAALQHRPDSDKILILVTDGEDLQGDALAAAKAAAHEGLKIFTVGVGTANGDLIPLPADQGGGFLRDSEGHLVKSRLDEAALKALATATGGSYAPLGAENQGLDSIYQEALAPLAKHDLESRAQKVYTQRFQWPLGAALVLLLASLMVGTRRRVARSQSLAADEPSGAANEPRRSRWHGRSPWHAPPTSAALLPSAALLAVCGLLPVHSADASPSSAAAAYQHGDFSAADRDYSAAAASNPKQPILAFDAGAAAYKAGQYPRAAEEFQASVNASTSADPHRLADQEDAYYNLGNTLYREGQRTEQANPEATIQSWTQAVKTYDTALQLRPDDADTQFNRDFVSHKLDALKKAQSQKNESQKNQAQQNPPKQPAQSEPSKPQPQAGQPKQPSGGQPQPGKGQPDKPNGQLQQANAQAGQPKGAPQQANAQAGQPKGQPQQATGQSGQHKGQSPTEAGDAQARDDQRLPGEMSRQEARELLDSVKNEEHRPPAAPVARNSAADSPSNEPLKDW